MRVLPHCEVVVAGWPCQDLSQAGRTTGITGLRSGLVGEIFRLVKQAKVKPSYIVLENVPFALHLQKGQALALVTQSLEDLGYRWAYRILDSKHFGLPQRRRRLFIVASRDDDPSNILFEGANSQAKPDYQGQHFGFYWTEGNAGVGWSPGAVPPLKGGSGLAIPSPPAIWNKATKAFVTPGIIDAERMQGFASGWTETDAGSPASQRNRWRLVGNAVSVPVAQWLGKRLMSNERGCVAHLPLAGQRSNAAAGGPKASRKHFLISEAPEAATSLTLDNFAMLGAAPLSLRAARGFYNRVTASPLRVSHDFVNDLRNYIR